MQHFDRYVAEDLVGQRHATKCLIQSNDGYDAMETKQKPDISSGIDVSEIVLMVAGIVQSLFAIAAILLKCYRSKKVPENKMTCDEEQLQLVPPTIDSEDTSNPNGTIPSVLTPLLSNVNGEAQQDSHIRAQEIPIRPVRSHVLLVKDSTLQGRIRRHTFPGGEGYAYGQARSNDCSDSDYSSTNSSSGKQRRKHYV